MISIHCSKLRLSQTCSKPRRSKLPHRTGIYYTGVFNPEGQTFSSPWIVLKGDTISMDTGIASYNGPDLLLGIFFSFKCAMQHRRQLHRGNRDFRPSTPQGSGARV